MATCGDDCCVKVWEISETGDSEYSTEVQCACVATVSGYHDRAVYSVDILKRRGEKRLLIASGGGDDRIVVVSCDPSETEGARVVVEAVIPGAHAQDVNCVRWQPEDIGNPEDTDGVGHTGNPDDVGTPEDTGRVYLLASCGDDGEVGVWAFDSSPPTT